MSKNDGVLLINSQFTFYFTTEFSFSLIYSPSFSVSFFCARFSIFFFLFLFSLLILFPLIRRFICWWFILSLWLPFSLSMFLTMVKNSSSMGFSTLDFHSIFQLVSALLLKSFGIYIHIYKYTYMYIFMTLFFPSFSSSFLLVTWLHFKDFSVMQIVKVYIFCVLYISFKRISFLFFLFLLSLFLVPLWFSLSLEIESQWYSQCIHII